MLLSIDSGIALKSSDYDGIYPEKTVCITGHREKSITAYLGIPDYLHMTRAAVRLMLYRYIDMAVEKGYTDFFSGLASGTDLWAAEYIILKKQTNSDIRLIGAMPFLKHSAFLGSDERRILRDIELSADAVILLNENPDITYSKNRHEGTSDDLYKVRNYFMADNSSAVISFFDDKNYRSGTAQTINHARRNGLEIHSFSLDDVFSVMDKSDGSFDDISRLIRSLGNVFE